MCLASTASIREGLDLLNRTLKGIVLVVDDRSKLLGIVTDGDFRRALLRGRSLLDPVSAAMQAKPLVVPRGTGMQTVSDLMRANAIAQVPVVDDGGHVVDVLFASRIVPAEPWTAVVMAGGEGQRLRPLTDSVPKPMLTVGGRPLLETIIRSLRMAGCGRVFLNVRYLADVIESHFGDGEGFGVSIHYLREPQPLGTAGGLSLIPAELRPQTPFLVVNGDLLTKLNFGVLRDFHLAEGYAATICCRPHEVAVPYGYPILSGDVVTDWREKPTFTYLVNSGIYCVDAGLLPLIPREQPFNMPDLIVAAVTAGQRVGVFPLREPFHEIGRIDSYREAEEFYARHFAVDA